MMTIDQIFATAGLRDADKDCYEEQGKWIVWDQIGSAGVMADAVARLKEAGVPAFYSAKTREWGVLASEVTL